MFGIGPAYLFILQNRLRLVCSSGLAALAQHHGDQCRHRSRRGRTDLVHRRLAVSPCATADHVARGIWRMAVLRAASIRETYWAKRASGNFRKPHSREVRITIFRVLQWFTANIGVHHVHHLSSRIPYYRLPRVLRDHPELRGVSRLTLVQSFQCVRLVLWDESRRRLISFRELSGRCVNGRNIGANDRRSH